MTQEQKKKKIRDQIAQNRDAISKMISGADSYKRLNNLNWLRHQISYEEPRTLFHMSKRDQAPFLDHTNMANLGAAYDYIISNPDTPIDAGAIRKLHSILCSGTHITGGLFRTSDKIIEITVNGGRMHAPDYTQIEPQLNDILYRLHNDKSDVLTRAFNIHYDLIALQPFDDFNKRTARLVMNWVLIQGGFRPITFNKPSDKQKYREAITAMANGRTKEYTGYMSETLLRTQKEILKTLKKSRI